MLHTCWGVVLVILYKIDILQALKDAGYSSYRIKNENLFGHATLTNIRAGKPINFDNLNRICKLTGLQPGDILQYIPDENEIY